VAAVIVGATAVILLATAPIVVVAAVIVGATAVILLATASIVGATAVILLATAPIVGVAAVIVGATAVILLVAAPIVGATASILLATVLFYLKLAPTSLSKFFNNLPIILSICSSVNVFVESCNVKLTAYDFFPSGRFFP
jgi:hypothetical protein